MYCFALILLYQPQQNNACAQSQNPSTLNIENQFFFFETAYQMPDLSYIIGYLLAQT